MYIFTDANTGDDLFTDAAKITDVDGLYYEVDAKLKIEKTTLDDRLFGANPSAEEQEEQGEDNVVSGIDVVIENNLQATGYGKKEFGALLKSYFAKALDQLGSPAELPEIKKRCAVTSKEWFSKYKEMEFWVGKSFGEDGLTAFSWYSSDKEVKMIFFKFGLKKEKC